jgi:hypothetical protein
MLPSRYQVYIATYVSVELSSDSYVVLYIRLPSTSGEFNHASVRTFFFAFGLVVPDYQPFFLL